MCRPQIRVAQKSSAWTATPVDPSASKRWISTADEPTTQLPPDANAAISRADRRAMLIMQVVEARKFQRECARPASLQRRALETNKRLATPPPVDFFCDDAKQTARAYCLLTGRNYENLISDVKTLINPKLAKDYTSGTVSQVCKLGLYQPSLYPFVLDGGS